MDAVSQPTSPLSVPPSRFSLEALLSEVTRLTGLTEEAVMALLERPNDLNGKPNLENLKGVIGVPHVVTDGARVVIMDESSDLPARLPREGKHHVLYDGVMREFCVPGVTADKTKFKSVAGNWLALQEGRWIDGSLKTAQTGALVIALS